MSKNNNKKLSKEDKKLKRREKKAAKKEMLAAMSVQQRKKYHLKNAAIITVCVFAALLLLCAVFGIVSWVIGALNDDAKESPADRHDVPDSRIVNVPYEHPTYTAFDAVWDRNVYEYKKFKEQILDIKYIEQTGVEYNLDTPIGAEKPGHRFFKKYFDILRNGDYKLYPYLFANSYIPSTSYETNINRKFPPQMVYGVTIEEKGAYNSTYNGVPCERSTYTVNYYILENDLLFRNDIGFNMDIEKDEARPIIFELITLNPGKDNEKTLIHNLYTEISLENSKNS